MYAIEFEADIRDGVVKIPEEFAHLKNSHAKIVVVVDEQEATRGEPVSLDFSDCDVAGFADKDGVEVQRDLRNEW